MTKDIYIIVRLEDSEFRFGSWEALVRFAEKHELSGIWGGEDSCGGDIVAIDFGKWTGPRT